MEALRVLIVADDPLVRAGLAALLADQPGYLTVGQLPAEADWLEQLEIFRPDVILWDWGWNPDRALDSLEELSEETIPIIVLLPDEAYVTEAWGAGIRGFLHREVTTDQLLVALAAVSQDLVVADSGLIPPIASLPIDEDDLAEALTPRELEVLQLLAEGLSNKQIAHRLEISEHTIKFHVTAIMGKLGAQSRTEAVVRATRLGLILL